MKGSEVVETLYPVVCKVPAAVSALEVGARVKALSRAARESVLLSARRTGVVLEAFPKGSRGHPLPWRGIHWSLTHKPAYVAGVVSDAAVGIDIERIKTVSTPLFERLCSRREAALFPEKSRDRIFFRCFTAKEAVLKRWGRGLVGLDDVSVISVIDAAQLLLFYENTPVRVVQFEIGGHLVSVSGTALRIKWAFLENGHYTDNW